MILEMENQPLAAGNDLARRIAERALAKRGAGYADEVRRLLDAGLAEMQRRGTGARPRVADIVAAAGLSNDAFYRHFPSKDALVAAILEDGAERLRSYLAHQMAKESSAEGKVRRWVEGVLAQAADPDIAASTRAVLWNAGGDGLGAGHPSMNGPLASLLVTPFADLGSADPELDASLVAHAVIGQLSDHLHRNTRPSKAVIAHTVEFAMTTAAAHSLRTR
jgi:AcrR family transcriptional regulator